MSAKKLSTLWIAFVRGVVSGRQMEGEARFGAMLCTMPTCSARTIGISRSTRSDADSDLPGSERNEDAEHDDADFAGELAPAVEQLWQRKAH